MKPELKLSKHCPHCDGTDVYQMTYWRWSVVSQDWESADDPLIRCGDCNWSGYEVKTKISEDEEE